MLKDRIALDLPAYEGLLAGHYHRGPGYGRKRISGTDDWLLVMTLAGSGRFSTGKSDHVVTAHQLSMIAPGTPHDYGTHRKATEWEILWVHFHPKSDWLEWLRWNEVAPGVFEITPDDPEPIEKALREIVELAHSNTEYRLPFAMNALEKLLLLCISEDPSKVALDDRIRRSIRLIHADLRLPHSIEDLSVQSGLSNSRFSHLFKEQIGLSPRQYLLQQRILQGRRLLERTALGVAEIAHQVGMDAVSFSLRFKAETGLSPRDFRKGLP